MTTDPELRELIEAVAAVRRDVAELRRLMESMQAELRTAAAALRPPTGLAGAAAAAARLFGR